MRRVLVDDDDAVVGLRDDIGVVQLGPRGAERIVLQRRLRRLGFACAHLTRTHLASAGREIGETRLRRVERGGRLGETARQRCGRIPVAAIHPTAAMDRQLAGAKGRQRRVGDRRCGVMAG